jgi:hypothetical protein
MELVEELRASAFRDECRAKPVQAVPRRHSSEHPSGFRGASDVVRKARRPVAGGPDFRLAALENVSRTVGEVSGRPSRFFDRRNE